MMSDVVEDNWLMMELCLQELGDIDQDADGDDREGADQDSAPCLAAWSWPELKLSVVEWPCNMSLEFTFLCLDFSPTNSQISLKGNGNKQIGLQSDADVA